MSQNNTLFLLLLLFGFWACNQGQPEATQLPDSGGSKVSLGPEKLSEYGFFTGNIASQTPAPGVMPYDLATPLFSDYAYKARFIKLPDGSQPAPFNDEDVFDFPVGTTIIKTFYYPHDMRDESKGRRLMETRLLVHEEKGWKALPYIWNDEQTDAILEVAGARKDVSWVHTDGSKRNLNYVIPNMNQCKGCHINKGNMTPIGPKARNLNKDYLYTDGSKNQLEKWHEAGIVGELPDMATISKVPVWNEPSTGSLNDRARAYLEINCAHCHRDGSPANTSGLLLDWHQKNPAALGINKSPVAAGRGSGGRLYDIDPGNPDASIMLFRMDSDDPGIMMPELGRKMIHTEGVALIKEWIASLPTNGTK